MLPNQKRNIRFITISILIIVISIIYGWRLSFPQQPYFDEVYHVKRAIGLAELHQYNHRVSIHPPLWHIFSAMCIALFGNNSFAWRLPSLICGILLILLTFGLTKKITNNRTIAYWAAFLFAFDCISITQARIAMVNSMMLMFMLLSLLSFLQYFLDQNRDRTKSFICAGVLLGAALATRFVACFLIIIFGAVTAIHLVKSRKDYLSVVGEFILYLVFIPMVIFLGVHLFIPLLENSSWADIWKHISYQCSGLVVTKGHSYGSEWWSWPLMLRPIWYFYKQQQDIVQGILCIGNQAIFWLIPVSMGYVLWNLIKKKTWDFGLILLGFFSLWLPWAFITRVKFFHYIYTAMPFVCMSIAALMVRIWQIGKMGKIVVIAYLILVVSLFIYWYPLLTGLPIPNDYFRQHMWFRSWI